MYQNKIAKAELAQLVERTTLNRVVEGSIPSFGVCFLYFCLLLPPCTVIYPHGQAL